MFIRVPGGSGNSAAQQQVNQDIFTALDGYVSEQTFQENKTAQNQINQTILQALDGYTTSVSNGISEGTFQENKLAQEEINDAIIQALDGYSASGAGAVSEQTFQENKTAQSEVNQTILTALDGYATLISGLDLTETQHTQQQNQINQTILQALDGYAGSGVSETTFQETKFAQSQINQTILQSLDGYALLTIENQRHIDASQQLQDIRNALDGYTGSAGNGVSEQTFQETKSAQSEINNSIIQSLDGYASLTIENQRWIDSSQQLQDIRNTLDGYATSVSAGVSEQTFQENKTVQEEINDAIIQALDGYSTPVGGVSETTFQENKTAQEEINDQILTALDGYAGGSGVSENTFQENKTAQQQINQSIIQSLDGYATLISGLDLTELQHTQQQNQINQTILQALDGYASLISGLDLTETQHVQQQNQVNQSILQSLDGYAIRIVEDQRWIDSSQQLQDIRNTLDGYATSVSAGVSEQTFQENKAAQEEINDAILQALDGYSASGAGAVSEQTFQETKFAQAQINQSILQALDGYSASGAGAVSEQTFQENKTAQEEINDQILTALDGYAGGGGVSETTFQENKNAQQQVNQTVLQSLDGYAVLISWLDLTETQHTQQQNQVNQSILQSLDGYALLSVTDQRWIDTSQQLQDIRNTLSDGYATEQTFQENKNYWNESISQLRISNDGYQTQINSLTPDITFQENKVAQQQINQTVLQALDGYAIRSIEDQRWIDSSQQIQDIRNTLIDGYVLETTFQETKTAQSQINQTIIQSLDGYSALISGLDLTELQHTQQQAQINQSIIQSLDGYALLISGLDLTEAQHTQQQNQINQTVLQALDGYALLTAENQRWIDSSQQLQDLRNSLDGYVVNQTFEENKNTQNEINNFVLLSLDGYASKITESEHYTQLSQAIQDIVSGIDGYSSDAEFLGLSNTVEDHKNYQNQVNQTILQTLDGYASIISGLDLTETQHTQQQNQINQSILQSLDGYALLAIENKRWADSSQQLQDLRDAADGYGITITDNFSAQQQINQSVIQALDGYASLIAGLDLTELQHTQQQNQINQSILQSLDGYAGGGGVSEQTFQENKFGQEQINQTILQALDGYANLISGIDLTELQHTQQQNQFNQSVLQSLDGYALLANEDQRWIDSSEQLQALRTAADGYAGGAATAALIPDTGATGDGYLMFSTGVGRNIAGDNDLFYDRVNSRLGISTTPAGGLHLLSQAADNAPTAFTSDDLVIGGIGADGGTNTGSLFLRYNKTIEAGFIGSLSPSVAWRPLSVGATYTSFLNGSGVKLFTISGVNGSNAISIQSTGTLAWAQSTDANDSLDVGLSRISASVVAIGNGTQGDTSGTLVAANVQVSGNIVNEDLSETFQVIRQALDGYAGGGGILEVQRFFAETLDDADGNWPNTANAAVLTSVGVSPSVAKREYIGASLTAAGSHFVVPANATNVRIDLLFCASAAPGTTNNKVRFKINTRSLDTTGAGSDLTLADLTNANDALMHLHTVTYDLGGGGGQWNIAAGDFLQFQLARVTSGVTNNMTQSACLAAIIFTWT